MVAGSQQHFDVQIHFQQDSERTFQSLEQSSLDLDFWFGLLLSFLGLVDHDDRHNHLFHCFERPFNPLETVDDCYFILLVAQGDLSIHTR
jgi:hypothetical protein